jgi:hypothetical protein
MASGIAGLAQAEAKELTPSQYTSQQLASLLLPYRTRWDASLYFVVIFSGIIILTSLLFALRLFFAYLWHRRGGDTYSDGESYLIRRQRSSTGSKPRPSTKILNALRGKDISNPMPSDDGHSEGNFKRESDGAGTGSYHSEIHGW